jgi:hypothetical protein
MPRTTKRQLEQQVQALERALSVVDTDTNFFPKTGLSELYRDRADYDRDKIFEECLRAWRVNPLARRIVKMTTAFVVGKKGISLSSDHAATNKFLQAWYSDPLNNFRKNIKRWMDEQTRTGNLFFLFTVDKVTGMSHVRASPADLIKEIQCTENDIEQETFYIRKDLNASPWEAFDPLKDQDTFMVHYAVNQPVGVPWGEPDMAPLLVWLGRYASWLEDRVRLNRFRSVFMYVLQGKFKDAAARRARELEVNANPPKPGSVLVTDESEQWGTLSANLDAFDASLDGLNIKKMISAGTPFPLHYLAEPESATRTTAEAAGTPTFRSLEDLQDDFFNVVSSLAKIAVTVRKKYDRRVNPEAPINVSGADITERDNSTLALALSRVYPALADMFDRHMIETEEVLRLAYRMAGEVYEPATGKVKGVRRPLKPVEPLPGTPNEPDPGEPEEEPANSAAIRFLEDVAALVDAIGNDAVIDLLKELPSLKEIKP